MFHDTCRSLIVGAIEFISDIEIHDWYTESVGQHVEKFWDGIAGELHNSGLIASKHVTEQLCVKRLRLCITRRQGE